MIRQKCNRYKADLRWCGKRIWVGSFETYEQAVLASRKTFDEITGGDPRKEHWYVWATTRNSEFGNLKGKPSKTPWYCWCINRLVNLRKRHKSKNIWNARRAITWREWGYKATQEFARQAPKKEWYVWALRKSSGLIRRNEHQKTAHNSC